MRSMKSTKKKVRILRRKIQRDMNVDKNWKRGNTHNAVIHTEISLAAEVHPQAPVIIIDGRNIRRKEIEKRNINQEYVTDPEIEVQRVDISIKREKNIRNTGEIQILVKRSAGKRSTRSVDWENKNIFSRIRRYFVINSIYENILVFHSK